MVDTTLEIIDSYEQGKTFAELAKEYHRSTATISRILHTSGAKVRPRGWDMRKYNLTQDYFSNIDTPSKAQVLGLIYADGTLCSDECCIKIQLQELDKQYLQDIADEIGSDKPLYHRGPKTMICPRTQKIYNQQGSFTLAMCSRTMFSDLQKFGLCFNKTDVDLSFPTIPESLYRSFILGFFEGDGCITFTNGKFLWCEFNIVSNEQMALHIQGIIEKHTGVKGNILKRKTTVKEMFYLRIRSKKSLKILHNWLYQDASFKMERKYNKWVEMLSLF